MKSLIIKDIYNISKNITYVILIYVVFAFVFISSSGIESYVCMCGAISGMMIVTTFSFDTSSNWNRYAAVMPVTKKHIVGAKFITLLIFTLCGIAAGVVIGCVIELIKEGGVDFSSVMLSAMVSLSIGEIFASMAIPIMFKVNVEKGRMVIILIYMIILISVFSVIKNNALPHMQLVIWCLPAAALLWNLLMYKVSCILFSKKDL